MIPRLAIPRIGTVSYLPACLYCAGPHCGASGEGGGHHRGDEAHLQRLRKGEHNFWLILIKLNIPTAYGYPYLPTICRIAGTITAPYPWYGTYVPTGICCRYRYDISLAFVILSKKYGV